MKLVIGIDEAGRGPLAGPVAVGVAVVPGNFAWSAKLPGVTDSKQLAEARREDIYIEARKLKKTGELNFEVALVSARVIDRIGIVPAINLAMKRALKRLDLDPTAVTVKLDGGLKAPREFDDQETIIKGDQKEQVIGLASICAKVTRDRYMVRKAAEPLFAPYDLATHKGYGTQMHREAIRILGLSELHRATFCRNINKSR